MDSTITDLAAEFVENGLDDVAEHLLTNGLLETRYWIDSVIAEAKNDDDPEGWILGNLEVARDRMENHYIDKSYTSQAR